MDSPSLEIIPQFYEGHPQYDYYPLKDSDPKVNDSLLSSSNITNRHSAEYDLHKSQGSLNLSENLTIKSSSPIDLVESSPEIQQNERRINHIDYPIIDRSALSGRKSSRIVDEIRADLFETMVECNKLKGEGFGKNSESADARKPSENDLNKISKSPRESLKTKTGPIQIYSKSQASACVSKALQRLRKSSSKSTSSASFDDIEHDLLHSLEPIPILYHQDVTTASHGFDVQHSPFETIPDTIYDLIYQEFPPKDATNEQQQSVDQKSFGHLKSRDEKTSIILNDGAESDLNFDYKKGFQSSPQLYLPVCDKSGFTAKGLHSDLGHVELYYAVQNRTRETLFISQFDCYCFSKFAEIEI